MDKVEARKIAEEVVEYLFLDNDNPRKPVARKPVARLMLVYGGEEYKNPGWSREAIRDAIVDHIVKSAQQSVQPTVESGEPLPADKNLKVRTKLL